MSSHYTNERNTQILISLFKHHGIKKVIASPGTTNMRFVGSIQNDPFFEVYSSADERSAAYMACGMAAESGEPIALSCTGATASRNYIPALTEAYYRKLPVCAVTSTQHLGRIGSHTAQVIDRTNVLNDIARISVQIPTVHSHEDEWACEIKLNKALLELKRAGGGPVHINLETTYSTDYSVQELPPVKVIDRIGYNDVMPELNAGKVAIYVGAHLKWSDELCNEVDSFCEKYNGAVICDQTSNYKGKYRVNPCLLLSQTYYNVPCREADLVIHIGEISGAYVNPKANEIWRVNPDGEIRDTFGKLRYVFEMTETEFFRRYAESGERTGVTDEYLTEWKNEIKKLSSKISELPFSNAWIAQQTADKLPERSVLHLGILNSLRTWNFFETSATVLGYANTGGFGIDGCVSTLLGASLCDPNKMYFGIVGDLAFFYDMNSLGNRHVGKNIRLMVINNGGGIEFKNYNHLAAAFGYDADPYIAAMGHYGNKSSGLLKHYAEDLGFEYIFAGTKEEYLNVYSRFIAPQITDRPILFEIFTDSKNESDALKALREIEVSKEAVTKSATKKIVKSVLGDKSINAIRKLIK